MDTLSTSVFWRGARLARRLGRAASRGLIAPKREYLAYRLRRLKNANRRLNDLESLTGRGEIHSFPPHIEVDFSIRCNFRCVMCHQSKLKFAPSELTSNEVKALIDVLPYVDTVLRFSRRCSAGYSELVSTWSTAREAVLIAWLIP